MSDSALFYIDGSTEGTTQWRAESFQMVNWGGFHGHHDVAFAPTATLVSGASGTGKSSLLDAYLALMMPSDTPFNGASNDAGSGRARSADQRNLMTYLKGKTDSTRETGTGQLHDQVLRGADSSTWGAVAMTFIDDNQRRFTVLRAYFLPRAATRFADISMKMATVDGHLDLRDLAEIAESRFDKRALKTRFPEMDVFDTYAAFAQTLFTRLGIGANGEGGKALRLLARIQAGQQVQSVDGLYKSMVLEQPATFAAADKAVDHFEDLERSYGAMVTEAQKAKVLERLPDLYRDFEAASAKADLIDTFGVHRDGDTPFVLWKLQTERSLLDLAADANRAKRRDNLAAFTRSRDSETDLKTGSAKFSTGSATTAVTRSSACRTNRRDFATRATMWRANAPGSTNACERCRSTSAPSMTCGVPRPRPRPFSRRAPSVSVTSTNNATCCTRRRIRWRPRFGNSRRSAPFSPGERASYRSTCTTPAS